VLFHYLHPAAHELWLCNVGAVLHHFIQAVTYNQNERSAAHADRKRLAAISSPAHILELFTSDVSLEVKLTLCEDLSNLFDKTPFPPLLHPIIPFLVTVATHSQPEIAGTALTLLNSAASCPDNHPLLLRTDFFSLAASYLHLHRHDKRLFSPFRICTTLFLSALLLLLDTATDAVKMEALQLLQKAELPYFKEFESQVALSHSADSRARAEIILKHFVSSLADCSCSCFSVLYVELFPCSCQIILTQLHSTQIWKHSPSVVTRWRRVYLFSKASRYQKDINILLYSPNSRTQSRRR
jgi:hypothetical protein